MIAPRNSLQSGTCTNHRHHSHHSPLQQAVDTLAEETGDQDYLLLFSSADSLHKNFYEGKMAQATVALHLAQVTTLVEKVEQRL